MTANATVVAAGKVRAKALNMAAQLLQADASSLTIANGNVVRVDGVGATISLGDLAYHLQPASKTRGDRDPGLAAEGWFTTAHMTYPYGVQTALVNIDPGTGAVHIEKMMIAFDVGRAINPMLVRGQLVGGFAQGSWRRLVRGVSIR